MISSGLDNAITAKGLALIKKTAISSFALFRRVAAREMEKERRWIADAGLISITRLYYKRDAILPEKAGRHRFVVQFPLFQPERRHCPAPYTVV